MCVVVVVGFCVWIVVLGVGLGYFVDFCIIVGVVCVLVVGCGFD